jgi:hypothetical protein
MKCGQTKCSNQPEYRYVWPPDGKEHDVCLSCVTGVVRLGAALGVQLRLERIAALDARKAVLQAAFAMWKTQLGSLRMSGEPKQAEKFEALMRAVETLMEEEARSFELAGQLLSAEPVRPEEPAG